MKHVLERQQLVRRPIDEVFGFFSDASNLEKITPPQLKFEIVTPRPIAMRSGALIEYQLRLFGVPFGWKTLIESFEPTSRFVDVQLRGPYKVWRHVHTFESVPGGTRMYDEVTYEVPFGPLGEVARALFVTRQVEGIFDFRRKIIRETFGEIESGVES
jgi:ligand-binding SRPBCC domain-containing protein